MKWPAVIYLLVHGFALALLVAKYWYQGRRVSGLTYQVQGRTGAGPRELAALMDAQQARDHLRRRLWEMVIMEGFHLGLLHAGGFFN